MPSICYFYWFLSTRLPILKDFHKNMILVCKNHPKKVVKCEHMSKRFVIKVQLQRQAASAAHPHWLNIKRIEPFYLWESGWEKFTVTPDIALGRDVRGPLFSHFLPPLTGSLFMGKGEISNFKIFDPPPTAKSGSHIWNATWTEYQRLDDSAKSHFCGKSSFQTVCLEGYCDILGSSNSRICTF